jgi:hypothetical protein
MKDGEDRPLATYKIALLALLVASGALGAAICTYFYLIETIMVIIGLFLILVMFKFLIVVVLMPLSMFISNTDKIDTSWRTIAKKSRKAIPKKRLK